MSPLALKGANQCVWGGNPDDVILMSLGLSQLRHGDNSFTTDTLHIHLRVWSLMMRNEKSHPAALMGTLFWNSEYLGL